ncbi:hypothetical protein GWI33_004622 [Rhynchophorus ferrugineus]|uniref:Uncharacterized protein n=1 Tax=Rhynchophorus ferrugineus TaxID=354439 RepID=A0A834IWH4_RHYFE|nr:hypothetical protein GWI33_004622 [Rhynchophorus ferrugineus]
MIQVDDRGKILYKRALTSDLKCRNRAGDFARSLINPPRKRFRSFSRASTLLSYKGKLLFLLSGKKGPTEPLPRAPASRSGVSAQVVCVLFARLMRNVTKMGLEKNF